MEVQSLSPAQGQSAREPWSVRSRASDAREILSHTMTTEARPMAIKLANRFIARGFNDFEAVLPDSSMRSVARQAELIQP